jgi:Ca2+/H+ antiporter, TMEM165/GDT1 family
MTGTLILVGSAFLASAVEMVEALTIVLAVGLTHNWRTALTGVLAALIALAIVVGALGPSLVHYVPIDDLRVVVGLLLIIFGLQWMRKAILRASGLKALHDEAQIFERELAELEAIPVATGVIDWTGFVVSFKGVFLEGLEVAFIVLTFGANSGHFGPALVGAALAVLMVGAIGAVVHRPLTRVPENAIKFIVGVALVAFGTFWGGEGIGVDWTLGDATIPLLAALYAGVAWMVVLSLQRRGATRLSIQGAQ